jgi:hypothetical protein
MMAALARQHVVPLEDLVEHDAIDEPADADAEQNPGARGRETACAALSPVLHEALGQRLSASGSTRMRPA